ncbi:MAG: hypothetical protein M8353_01120 [ANME-2 cluster archaeon]|nr:hypothetical protein [ANME-2 cluster archaeon]
MFGDKGKIQKSQVLTTLIDWRELEFSRMQKRTPVLDIIDSMIMEVRQELMNLELDLSEFCCLNKDCPDYGKKGKGNIRVKERYESKNRTCKDD